MGSTVTDRISGLSTSVAVKVPVEATTTGNIALSGLGVQAGGTWSAELSAGDRILVKDQDDAKENGIYTVFTSEWRRAKDFDGYRDVVKGTAVALADSGDRYLVSTENPIVIGSSEISFVPHPDDFRVMFVGSVADNISDYAASATDGQQYVAAGYLPGVFALANPSMRGGGTLIYASGVAKSEHNGVTVFSPTVPKISDQAGATLQDQRDNFINGVGETDGAGSGCFIRPASDTVHSSWAGTFADETNDDYVALQAAIDASPSTFFLDNGSHLTTLGLKVDSRINVDGIGSERTSGLGSHIRHTGTDGPGFIYTDTVSVYDRTVSNISVTSVNDHAFNIRYGCVRCEFLNLRLDSRSINHSALYGDYSTYGIGIFTCRFIGGEYFGSNTLSRNVPIVDFLTSATLINENIFRDMWVSYSRGVPAMRVRATGSGVRLTNNKFESITFEVCEGGLISLSQCSHTKIDGISAWDSPAYTGDLITLDACVSTTIINYGRIGGVPDSGIVDVRLSGSGAGTVIINYSAVGAGNPVIDWAGQNGIYIGAVSALLDHQNAGRVVRVDGDKIISSNYNAPDTKDAWLRATGDAEARLSSEHTGSTRTVSLDANAFYGGGGAFRPDQDSVLDLGASSIKWKNVHAVAYRANGLAGATGTFTTADSKTVTVTNGIITGIV